MVWCLDVNPLGDGELHGDVRQCFLFVFIFVQECGSTYKRLMSTLPGLSMGGEKLLCLVFGENILPKKVFCCCWVFVACGGWGRCGPIATVVVVLCC